MDDLDEFLYGESIQNDAPQTVATGADSSTMQAASALPAANAASVAADKGEDDYSEDEDELEIVLDEAGNDIQQDTSAREALQLKPTEGADGDAQPTANEAKIDEVLPLKGHINISGIGEFDGRKILEIDLDAIEDKPWRKPGADITDYFNYGFNENSWRAYCIKQKQLREEASLKDGTHFDFKKSSYQQPSSHGGYSQQQKSGYHGGNYEVSSGRKSRDSRRSRSRSPPLRDRSRSGGRRPRDQSSDGYRHRDDRYGSSKRRY